MKSKNSLTYVLIAIIALWAVYFFYFKEPASFAGNSAAIKYYKRMGWLNIGTFNSGHKLTRLAELKSPAGSELNFSFEGKNGPAYHTYAANPPYEQKAILFKNEKNEDVVLVFRSE